MVLIAWRNLCINLSLLKKNTDPVDDSNEILI